MIRLMRKNNWGKVVVLASMKSDQLVHLDTQRGLQKQFDDAGGIDVTPYEFKPDEINAKLSTIKASDIRIVILLADMNQTQTVALQASKKGMNKGWAWIICLPSDAVPQMHGWLYLRPLLWQDSEEGSGKERERRFQQEVRQYTRKEGGMPSQNDSDLPNIANFLDFSATDDTSADYTSSVYSVALHDAVMLYAHALSSTGVAEAQINVTRVAEAVRNTAFHSVSGVKVELDHHADRIESYEVMNYVKGADDVMDHVLVGVYNSTQEKYDWKKAVNWPGNTLQVPTAYVPPPGAPLRMQISFPDCHACLMQETKTAASARAL